MTHLSESEFVDFAEGALDGGRSAHLDTCATCRSQAASVRSALRAATAAARTEPSPLFWEHLSARIREGIAAEPQVRRAWWRPRLVAALAGAAAILVAIGLSVRRLPEQTITSQVVKRESAPASTALTVEASTEAPPVDAAWALLTDAASDMLFDDATQAGLSVRPGAVDSAVLDLTPAERDALGRLLQDAIKSRGASRKTL